MHSSQGLGGEIFKGPAYVRNARKPGSGCKTRLAGLRDEDDDDKIKYRVMVKKATERAHIHCHIVIQLRHQPALREQALKNGISRRDASAFLLPQQIRQDPKKKFGRKIAPPIHAGRPLVTFLFI